MEQEIQEIKERLDNLEKATFGFTRSEADSYLKRVAQNVAGMSDIRMDDYYSRNLETIQRAEKCLGV